MKHTKEARKYHAVHQWLYNNHEKRGKCDFCSSTNGKRYEFALKNGLGYENNRANFFELCSGCHRQYDSNVANLIRANTRAVFAEKDGSKKRFSSVKEAMKEIDVLPSSVSNVLKGRALTASGYRWTYAT